MKNDHYYSTAHDRRRKYLIDLALQLIKPQTICDDSENENIKKKRKRCEYCESNDRKTSYCCIRCKKYICLKDHSYICCKICKNNIR